MRNFYLSFLPMWETSVSAFCPCEKLLSQLFAHVRNFYLSFLPMWETSVSHDHLHSLLVLGTIHLKVVASSLVETPTPQVRFPYPAWTLMMDSYILLAGCKKGMLPRVHVWSWPYHLPFWDNLQTLRLVSGSFVFLPLVWVCYHSDDKSELTDIRVLPPGSQ